MALFHHHTMRVALAGVASIALYKILFTGFKAGPRMVGFFIHLGNEWVILANLLCLLTGLGDSPSPGLGSVARNLQGFDLPSLVSPFCFDDAGGEIASRILAHSLGTWLFLLHLR
ncbi:MAG TPA: hypothetical protein VGI60_11490 [Chthoniobacterales bacterium]